MTYPLPLHPRTGRPHVQAEAFCLMLYRAKDGSEEEWIWNSRDGITPFGTRLRSGAEAVHTDWHLDRYLPNHVPRIGDRIWVDMTPAMARQRAGINLDVYLSGPNADLARETYPDRSTAVGAIALELLEQFWPHTPALVEVTFELEMQFRSAVHAGLPPALNGVG